MSFIKAPKSNPKISYIPFGAVSYQKLEPFWHGSTGQTGPGFPDGFEVGGVPRVVKDANGEEVPLKGAVMRGPSGISGPTGHMTCNWWPYINKGVSLNNKILRGEYYIPLGVLGYDASGVPYPDEKFMKGRGYTGANNRDYIYKKGITFGISGNIILDTANDDNGGKISCKSCDVEDRSFVCHNRPFLYKIHARNKIINACSWLMVFFHLRLLLQVTENYVCNSSSIHITAKP